MTVAPDLTEKVVGWRAFAVSSGHRAALYPIARSRRAWVPGVNRAECYDLVVRQLARYGGLAHLAPDPACGCGLYAYHSQERLLEHFGVSVRAVILAWGRIEVHHEGFRAEYAEVAAIAHTSWLYGPRLAERYGVPLLPAGELPAFAATVGSPIPEQLRPASGKTESRPI